MTERVWPSMLCHVTKDDMAALADCNPDYLGQLLGVWNPQGCLNLDFLILDNEATIGYLRHAEIKLPRLLIISH
jgi:hypothetical protein